MRSFSKILLPVDFSERSVGAARYVRLLAERSQAEAILLHVAVPAPFQLGPMEMASMPIPDLYRSQMELFQKDLDGLRESELGGIRTRTVVLEGDPAARIVEFAHREEAGLIVMPTHGYGPFRRFLLGSVTAKALHDLDCPVWTGPHLENAPKWTSITIRRVACAVDFGLQTRAVLGWGSMMAREFGADLVILHS
ncbi:MAG TPA: universal stress protein, partial [Bryobacteraceae bacterium]|nr:universal stress protein [Bryobacteraceae bacterium]